MLGLAAGKAAAFLAGAVVATTVLVHNGRPYEPQPYTRWLSTFAVPGPPGYVDFAVGGCVDPLDLGCMTWTPSSPATASASRRSCTCRSAL
jgi:hypothetical protein